MSDAENAFVEATDNLIGLYRGVERNTLDLPPVSVMPVLICFWSTLRFCFFFFVGFFLIVPTNLVILIRNLFPGHWRYRPFFLPHLYYVCLWVWRGEAPTAPLIFVRPLLNVFMKRHFERRLRRLRLEILLRDGLSDATRSSLLTRLDAALERWKSPRFAAIYGLLYPIITGFISLYEKVIEFLERVGIRMPADVVNFVSEHMSTLTLRSLGLSSIGYLLAVPITAFLAKRGLFLGADASRTCFPGEQGGRGVYSKEKEILGSVGLRGREAPIDLWLLGASFVLGQLFLLLTWDDWMAWARSRNMGSQFPIQIIVQIVLFVGLFFVASLRRGRTGRA
jgi:hypothetical protein